MDAQVAQGFHCPRWGELPTLPLYMDQVMLVLEEAVGVFAGEGERVVTSSMVNNYVKHRLVQAPEKKKYGRSQLAALVVVSVLKRVLSMSEIAGLVRLMDDAFGEERAYDLFCEELEQMLRAGFCENTAPPRTESGAGRPQAALNAALLALMGKLLLQSLLDTEPAHEEA